MSESDFTPEQLSLRTTPGMSVDFGIDYDEGTEPLITGPLNGDLVTRGKVYTYTPRRDFNGTEHITASYRRGGLNRLLTVAIKVAYAFRAKSHILSLLGDELIGSDSLAIFELVKNSYDADAQEVKITFSRLNTQGQSIIVEDDGDGMTIDILANVWLEIGTDFKRGTKRTPSRKFGRISLGEKGVGRLAIHKLGSTVVLETQPEGSGVYYRLQLNWPRLMESHEYIEDTEINIETIQGNLFQKGRGTRITIKELKKQYWDRRELRDLTKKVNSIKSPFSNIKGSFQVSIDAGDYNSWIEDIKDVDSILNDAIYHFEFRLKKDPNSRFAALSWNYSFSPPKSFSIESRKETHPDPGETSELSSVFDIRSEKNDSMYLDQQKHLLNDDLDGIGEVTGRFYVFNLLSVVLRTFGQTHLIKAFVRENSGVKIFRDGIRVYNYGEYGDDWLGLDLARVQRLGSHFSKNVTIGAIEITQEGSFQNLKEKTNREGFDENPTFLKFRNICGQVFRLFETMAQKDRENLRNYLDGLKPVKSIGLPQTLEELTNKLREKDLEAELGPLVKRVERDYNDMRDVMLNSGMTGINLGIVFHEVDREVRFINADLKSNVDLDGIKQRVKNLIQLLESFSPILKQNRHVSIRATQLAIRARDINQGRFIYHNIIFSSPLITGESPDFEITGPGNLLISALSNILDNAIYWVSSKRELEGQQYKTGILLSSDVENFSGPAIIVADNGNGFTLDPEDLIMPYRTTRPGGMGLGLYFVNLVMEMIGGKLVFPAHEDINISPAYKGAILALVFPKTGENVEAIK